MAASLGTYARGTAEANSYSASHNNDGDGLLVVSYGTYEIGVQTPAFTWDAGAPTTAYTLFKDGANHTGVQFARWASPATGSKTGAVTGFSTDRISYNFFPTNGTSGTVTDSDGQAGTGVTSRSVTLTTVVGDLVLVTLAIAVGSDPTVVVSAGGLTELSEGLSPAFLWVWNGWVVAAGTSLTITLSWTGSANATLAAVSLEAAAAGGSIPKIAFNRAQQG